MIEHFHFLRPYLLLLFIPLIILIILLSRRQLHTGIWSTICSKDLMPYIIVKKAKQSYVPYLLAFIAFSLLIIALAGPAWQLISQPLIKAQSGLVIALDLSPAMNAEDIKPSRLQRAIYKINDFLNLRQEGYTALLVFSESPFVVTPLTDDTATIKALLPALDTKIMPSTGHQVHRAINKSIDLLHQAGISNGSILLVTAELSPSDMEQAINLASQQGVKVFILGTGTEQTSPIAKPEGGFMQDSKGALIMTTLAQENLHNLAKATQGEYKTIALDDSDIHYLSARMNAARLSDNQENTELTQTKWHDQGYLLVLIALPFVSLIFRRGLLVLSLFLIPPSLQALSWDDLWQTKDQQAQYLFQQEKFQEAKETFQNPDWQAAASYQLGDYEEAAQLFENNQTPDGFYNYGTAKAKQGDFERALEAYNKALEINPDHEDALFNKKLIEDLLKQNQNSQNSDQKKDDSNQDKQDDKQQQNDNSSKDKEGSESQNKQESSENKDKDNQQTNQKQNEQNNSSSTKKDKEEQLTEELQDEYREKIEEEMQKPKEEKAQPLAQEEDVQQNEQQKLDERWLQRIPDDPGGLLRRKFLQQYREQK